MTDRTSGPDRSGPHTLETLLTADPTARVSIEPREGGHLIRITVTAAAGGRHLVMGADLGEAVALALLAVRGPA